MYGHETCFYAIASLQRCCVSSCQPMSECGGSCPSFVLAVTRFIALSWFEVLKTFTSTCSPFRVSR